MVFCYGSPSQQIQRKKWKGKEEEKTRESAKGEQEQVKRKCSFLSPLGTWGKSSQVMNQCKEKNREHNFEGGSFNH